MTIKYIVIYTLVYFSLNGISTSYLSDYDISPNGDIAILRKNDSSIFYFNHSSLSWLKAGVTPEGPFMKQISISNDKIIMVLSKSTRNFYYFNYQSKVWNNVNKITSTLTFSVYNSNPYTIGNDELIYSCRNLTHCASTSSWDQIDYPNKYSQVANGPNGELYTVKKSGFIHRYVNGSMLAVNQQFVIPGKLMISNSNSIYSIDISNFKIVKLNDNFPYDWLNYNCDQSKNFFDGTPYEDDSQTSNLLICHYMIKRCL